MVHGRLEERDDDLADQFGALAPLYGTVITSLIAMLIAVPLAFVIFVLVIAASEASLTA